MNIGDKVVDVETGHHGEVVKGKLKNEGNILVQFHNYNRPVEIKPEFVKKEVSK